MDTAESVASPELIREEIEATRASLTEKLVTLESEVRTSVDGASESVKTTVRDIKQAFRPSHWVEKKPWTAFGVSVAAGLAAGMLLQGRARPSEAEGRFRPYSRTSSDGHVSDIDIRSVAGSTATGATLTGPTVNGSTVSGSTVNGSTLKSTFAAKRDDLLTRFRPEIETFKQEAIGTAVGIAAAFAKGALSNKAPPEITRIIDNVALKLGGKKLT